MQWNPSATDSFVKEEGMAAPEYQHIWPLVSMEHYHLLSGWVISSWGSCMKITFNKGDKDCWDKREWGICEQYFCSKQMTECISKCYIISCVTHNTTIYRAYATFGTAANHCKYQQHFCTPRRCSGTWTCKSALRFFSNGELIWLCSG